jgi:hypothetical protein
MGDLVQYEKPKASFFPEGLVMLLLCRSYVALILRRQEIEEFKEKKKKRLEDPAILVHKVCSDFSQQFPAQEKRKEEDVVSKKALDSFFCRCNESSNG